MGCSLCLSVSCAFLLVLSALVICPVFMMKSKRCREFEADGGRSWAPFKGVL